MILRRSRSQPEPLGYFTQNQNLSRNKYSNVFPLLPLMPAILSQRSLVILRRAGVGETFYAESNLALDRLDS